MKNIFVRVTEGCVRGAGQHAEIEIRLVPHVEGGGLSRLGGELMFF